MLCSFISIFILFFFFQSNRVILKMDITHEDHPSLIGKKGLLNKQVSEITNCLIHFPDINLRAASVKSNLVYILNTLCFLKISFTLLRSYDIGVLWCCNMEFIDRFQSLASHVMLKKQGWCLGYVLLFFNYCFMLL